MKKIWRECASEMLVFLLTERLEYRYGNFPIKSNKNIFSLIEQYVCEFDNIYKKY